MPSSSLAADAVLANRGFTADAVILGNRLRHDRTLDHQGVQAAESVVLVADIGPYPAGTDVVTVLQDFAARLNVLESANRTFRAFTVDAFIRPYFNADAVIRKGATGSFSADAVINRAFTANAVIKDAGTARSFTANAFIV